MKPRLIAAGAAFAVFVGMVVASNALLQHFGLLNVGLPWLIPAGTFCAAITWPARDVLSRLSGPTWGPWVGLLAVFVGAGISFTISATLATASAVAYLASEGTDWFAFWTLGGQRAQGPRYLAPLGVSTMLAAVVDSVVFLSIAGISWSVAGPGLLLAKFATIVVVGIPVSYRLRNVVPVPA